MIEKEFDRWLDRWAIYITLLVVLLFLILALSHTVKSESEYDKNSGKEGQWVFEGETEEMEFGRIYLNGTLYTVAQESEETNEENELVVVVIIIIAAIFFGGISFFILKDDPLLFDRNKNKVRCWYCEKWIPKETECCPYCYKNQNQEE